MKPAWDKLMGEFEGNPTVLVGDADCTAAGKELCDSVGVKGYPTIKHGDPADLQDYKGGRTFDDLKKFASEMKPSCSPKNIDLCDDDKKKQIEEFKAMGAEKREAQITEQEGAQEKLEKDFKEFVEGLQKSYQEASDKKEKDVEAIKNSGLGLLKAVNTFEKSAKNEL